MSGGAIASGHADADGKTLRFALTQPVRLHQSALGDHAVVDLAPQNFTGAMPDLAAAAQAAPPSRWTWRACPKSSCAPAPMPISPDWCSTGRKDVPYHGVSRRGKNDGALSRRWRGPICRRIARFAPPWVKNAAWHIDGNATVVEFETDSDSGFHDFKDGTNVVLDILAPKTDARRLCAARHSTSRKSPRCNGAIIGGSQAKAIADTASQLAGKGKPAASGLPKPDAKAGRQSREAKADDAKPADTKAAGRAAAAPTRRRDRAGRRQPPHQERRDRHLQGRRRASATPSSFAASPPGWCWRTRPASTPPALKTAAGRFRRRAGSLLQPRHFASCASP